MSKNKIEFIFSIPRNGWYYSFMTVYGPDLNTAIRMRICASKLQTLF